MRSIFRLAEPAGTCSNFASFSFRMAAEIRCMARDRPVAGFRKNCIEECNQFRIRQHVRRKCRPFNCHRRIVGHAQTADADTFSPDDRPNVTISSARAHIAAIQPGRADNHAASCHILRKRGEMCQRLLDAGRTRSDERARTMPLHKQSIIDQALHGFANGDPWEMSAMAASSRSGGKASPGLSIPSSTAFSISRCSFT